MHLKAGSFASDFLRRYDGCVVSATCVYFVRWSCLGATLADFAQGSSAAAGGGGIG